MRGFWGAALLLLAASVSAKDKLIPLSEPDAAALRGKTVALTLHERPSFTAGTAGKATFGLLGAGAMIAAGNKIVDENGVQDPGILVRTQLATVLREIYGANVLEADQQPTKAKKPKEVAALHPQADYVLDIRSGGWMFFYYPSDWNNYWVGYSVQSQLVETSTARQVSNMACNASTNQSAVRPSREQLIENGAQLLKDVTQHLGWLCTQLLAKDQYRLDEEQLPAIPAEYREPLARLTAPAPESATGSTTADTLDPAVPSADASLSPIEIAGASEEVASAVPEVPEVSEATGDVETSEAADSGSTAAPTTP
jgi:hypothetical protein